MNWSILFEIVLNVTDKSSLLKTYLRLEMIKGGVMIDVST